MGLVDIHGDDNVKDYSYISVQVVVEQLNYRETPINSFICLFCGLFNRGPTTG